MHGYCLLYGGWLCLSVSLQRFRGSPSLGWGCEGRGGQRGPLPPLGPGLHTGTPAGPGHPTAETPDREEWWRPEGWVNVADRRSYQHACYRCVCTVCVGWLPVWIGWRTEQLETSARSLLEETAWHHSESGMAPSDNYNSQIWRQKNVTGLSDITLTQPSSEALSPDCQSAPWLVEVCVLPGKAASDWCSRGRPCGGTLDNIQLSAAAQHSAGAAGYTHMHTQKQCICHVFIFVTNLSNISYIKKQNKTDNEKEPWTGKKWAFLNKIIDL